MRKITLALCFLASITAFSQEDSTPDFNRNEIKFNAMYLILGSFEATYERLLNEESGIGISVNVPFIAEDWDLKYSVTPYYRYYFGKKPAQGFFGEGFGMLNTVNDYVYDESNGFFDYQRETITDFALGIGIGGKWVSKRGVLLEISGGVGRNLFNNSERDYEFIGRGGITVGYRF